MLNSNSRECGFEHEIVSYMYDELGAVERAQFETHLVDCTSCTDLFAAVSFSRFSVFEWQKDEFANLPTPEIVIPYESKKAVVRSAGWLSGLTEIFAFGRSPLALGGAFAVILAIGLVGFNFVGTGSNDIASNSIVPPVAIDQKLETPRGSDSPVAVIDKGSNDAIRPVTASSRDTRPKAVRQTSPSRRIGDARSLPNPTRQARRAPVLNDLGDDDEDSLRLSDMFDEIGG